MLRGLLVAGLCCANLFCLPLGIAAPAPLSQRFFVNANFGAYTPDNKRNLKTSPLYGLDFGVNFSPMWAGVLSGFSMTPDRKQASGQEVGYFLHLDGQFTPPVGNTISPYLAAGVGILKLNNAKTALDVGAGLRLFAIQQANVSLSINYRYVYQLGKSRSDYLVYMSAGWYFGGKSKADQIAALSKQMPVDNLAEEYQLPKDTTLDQNKLSMEASKSVSVELARLPDVAAFMTHHEKIKLVIAASPDKQGLAELMKQRLVNVYGVDAQKISA